MLLVLLVLMIGRVCGVLQVTPEVLRELDLAAARGQKGAAAPLAALQPAAVGQHVAEDVRNLPPVPMDDE